MPEKDEILIGLQSIVSQYSVFAMIWHFLFYAVIVSVMAGWRTTNRTAVLLLALPLISVSVFAYISGNPFNSIVFGMLGILSIIAGFIASAKLARSATLPYRLAGSVMVLFGLVYPHFMGESSLVQYLYASPAGLIPCPTLSVIIGFLIFFKGFSLGKKAIIYILAGLFYGVFGVMKLGVIIDLFLVIGSLILLVQLALLRNNLRTAIIPEK